MGFFSKIFYTPPPREEWSEIALNISKSVESVSEIWFAEAVQTLKENSLEVKNTTLDGDGKLALRAYLLYLSAVFTASNEYIARADGKDFGDILFAYVCGNEIEEVLKFFSRYFDADGGELISRFSGDISSYILEEQSAFALLFLAPSTVKLGLMIDVDIAKYFGDKSTSDEMYQKLQNFSS